MGNCEPEGQLSYSNSHNGTVCILCIRLIICTMMWNTSSCKWSSVFGQIFLHEISIFIKGNNQLLLTLYPTLKQLRLVSFTVADLRGGAGDARPPGSKFFRFHAVFGKFWQNRMLVPPRGVGAPSSGKSWIRHWFNIRSCHNKAFK